MPFRRLEVDVDHRRPAVDVEARDRPDLADAGVADEHVEAAELLDRECDEALEVLALGDVRAPSRGPVAASADAVGQFIQTLGAPRSQHDGGASLGEQQRGRLADPAARAGDGDNLAFDPRHGGLRSTKVDTCPVSTFPILSDIRPFAGRPQPEGRRRQPRVALTRTRTARESSRPPDR